MTIEELKRLEGAATPGPWIDYDGVEQHPETGEQIAVCPPLIHEGRPGGEMLCEGTGQGYDQNIALIAALRNAAPALVRCAELVAEMVGPGDTIDLSVMLDRARSLMADLDRA